jgi:hypothetical protein
MARPVSFLGQGKEIKDAPNEICILCATVVFNAPSIDPPIKKYANEEVCMVQAAAAFLLPELRGSGCRFRVPS